MVGAVTVYVHVAVKPRITSYNVCYTKLLRIWERGAGYTLASGSSSCAAACALVKRGLVDGDLTMYMQGGTLMIQIDKEWNIRMTGEVREVAKGILSQELLEDLNQPLAG